MSKEPYTEPPGYNAKHASNLALESRINKELAKMRFDEIIKLGNENHEQRGQMALLREEIKELHRDKERLDWILSDAGKYWLSLREDVDKEMN
jgi:hypothetical protein